MNNAEATTRAWGTGASKEDALRGAPILVRNLVGNGAGSVKSAASGKGTRPEIKK